MTKGRKKNLVYGLSLWIESMDWVYGLGLWIESGVGLRVGGQKISDNDFLMFQSFRVTKLKDFD